MKQLLACLLLLSLTISTLADDCNNPLLTTLGLTQGKYNTPTTVSGLKYCSTLKATGKACCSADTINSIQDKTAALGAKITNYVAARDKALVNARDNTLPALKASFQQFKDAMTKQLAALDAVPGDKTFTNIIKEMMQSIISSSDNVYNNLASYKANYNSFQKSRTTCMVELLKLQASAYCLACDPTYASRGVSGNTVTMSDRVCSRVQSACYTYLQGAGLQNGILYAQAFGEQLTSLTASLANLGTGSGSGQTIDLSSSGSKYASLSAEKLLAVLPSEMPSSCTSATNCKWACDNLVQNGVLSETLAVLGGAQYSSSRRLLLDEEEEEEEKVVVDKNQRRLAASSWDPEQNEAGVTVTFNDDPGNTATPNSGSMLKVGVMCVIGMVVALLF